MGYSFYQYFGIIPNDSKASLEGIEKNLKAFYEKSTGSEGKPTITLKAKEINISFPSGYQFNIGLSDEEHVHAEAQELAEDFKVDWNEKSIDKQVIETSRARFEMSADEDFDMDYFNDSLFIVEQLEKEDGVVVFSIE